MNFWKRAASLQLGPKRYDLSSLFFTFDVPFQDSEELGTATVAAYNLSQSTRASIKKGMVVILNAGYEGDVGTIFVGKVSRASSKKQATDWITTIEAVEALDKWLSKEVNKTYVAGIKASAVLNDLLTMFGLEVGQMELVEDKVYPRGKVCKGKVKDAISEIVTLDCKSRFLIRNGIITISDPTKGLNMGFHLSQSTGLLRSTEETEDTETTTNQTTIDNGEEQEPTYRRRCLLNYHLGPADIVKITSNSLKGNYLIKGGKHSGSPSGDWITEIEVKPA